MSLIDPQVIAFVAAPAVAAPLTAAAIWRKRHRASLAIADVPEVLLDSVAGSASPERFEWISAMTAELDHIDDRRERWRFALGCTLASLFSPGRSPLSVLDRRVGILGVLSVAVPPLGLPFLYLMAAYGDLFLKLPGTSMPENYPLFVKSGQLIALMLSVSGIPLGICSLLRGERSAWLAKIGLLTPFALAIYFFLAFTFIFDPA